MTPVILVLDDAADALAADVTAAWGEGAPALLCARPGDALPEAARRAQVLLAPPDAAAEVLAELPGLRWLQCTWAGVAPVLGPLRKRRDLLLTNARGIFGPRMAEYVFGWIAAVERRMLDYRDQQRRGLWKKLPERDLAGRTLGLLGTGSIGAHLAGVGRAFGMEVIGISRSGAPVEGIDRVVPVSQMLEVLPAVDYLVASVPDTYATRNLLGAEALAALPKDAILVNVGRGGVIDDGALVATLDRGRLRAAVLDVFDVEPLPPEHPFWSAPRLHLTPHVAAVTPRDGIARQFADNLRRWLAGEPLYGVVDVDAGY